MHIDEETATIVVQELMGDYKTLEPSVADASGVNIVKFFKVCTA